MKDVLKYVTIITIAFMAVSIIGMLVGCDATSTAAKEQKQTEANQSRLLEAQPPVSLKWSLEREQINKRTTLWNDPNKVSYIYLINYGKVLGFYIIKGKVSSVNSQITNPMQTRKSHQGITTLPSPAEDGSYGTNGDAIFFFTTDSIYVEWKGDYMLSDQKMNLSTPPTITYVKKIK